ncbi:MAG: hypothetical protein WD270_01075 [Acetobacterales bacterium]
MALFYGTYLNKVDRKGRVSVPAAFRAVLDKRSAAGIVLRPSHKAPALDIYTVEYFESLNSRLGEMDVFSDEQDELALALFGDARELMFDSEGRIMLPRDLMDKIGIDANAAFIGRGESFQVWEPATAEAHKRAAIERARAKGVTLPKSSAAGPA